MGIVAGVGFANLDMIYSDIQALPKEGEEVYAKNFAIKLGGGVPATLTNLKRLGVPTKVVTFLGNDVFSKFVSSELKRYGVTYKNLYEGCEIPVNLTTTMLTKHDRTFLSYRSPIQFSDETFEAVEKELSGADIIEMHQDFLDVYRRIKKENPSVRMVFDCGWEEDLSIEKYRGYLELADYYTPNKKEALKITGESSVRGAARVLGQFFDDVVIKLDRDGCYYWNKITQKEMIIPPMPDVISVDSTGAGDAFLSGFIYGLIHKCSVPQCILYGNITGGTCVQGYGCLTKYVNEKELLEKADEMTAPEKPTGAAAI
jgi:ribokinase